MEVFGTGEIRLVTRYVGSPWETASSCSRWIAHRLLSVCDIR